MQVQENWLERMSSKCQVNSLIGKVGHVIAIFAVLWWKVIPLESNKCLWTLESFYIYIYIYI